MDKCCLVAVVRCRLLLSEATCLRVRAAASPRSPPPSRGAFTASTRPAARPRTKKKTASHPTCPARAPPHLATSCPRWWRARGSWHGACPHTPAHDGAPSAQAGGLSPSWWTSRRQSSRRRCRSAQQPLRADACMRQTHASAGEGEGSARRTAWSRGASVCSAPTAFMRWQGGRVRDGTSSAHRAGSSRRCARRGRWSTGCIRFVHIQRVQLVGGAQGLCSWRARHPASRHLTSERAC
jgi:hypothetical protein